MLKRFGKVIQEDITTGLHYRYPYPIETVEIQKTSSIRRIEFGYRGSVTKTGSPTQTSSISLESETLTGDENIVNLLFSVQYSIHNLFQYQQKIDNQELLVKNLSESLVRQVLGQKKIDWILTIGRGEIESKVKELLQTKLDLYEAGVRVQNISIVDDHPPMNIHRAFRDVASSEEDKKTRINEAYAYRNVKLSKARGEAKKSILEAQAYQIEKLNQAAGEAQNFLKKNDAYKGKAEITELRLYLEMV
ncbi:MAG: FtsH protease activity modulator HflK, partial [Proteobacteria bacterium]|nr:FtsH protease activity modulator HflK [Pseudomonadota bacterium]